MGDAKRRKQLDPTFGNSSHRFTIATSDVTGNFLIMVDKKFVYESACKRADAERVIADLTEYIKDHPMPPREQMNHKVFFEWTLSTIGATDLPQSVSLNLDLKTGKMSPFVTESMTKKSISEEFPNDFQGTNDNPLR